MTICFHIEQLLLQGVVSAPLWNSERSRFAGMLTVLDLIHLIQHYYRTASYDTAAADVETFRLESLRGSTQFTVAALSSDQFRSQTSRRVLGSQRHHFYMNTHLARCTTLQNFLSKPTLAAYPY